MKYFSLITSVAIIALTSGCLAISHPMTAGEFRTAMPGSFMSKVEKYEVDQPYEKVADRFKKMAPKCFDASIKTTSRTNTSYQVIVTEYKPTVIIGKTRAELHVQQHHAQGVMRVSEEPKGGYYLMVFDAIKLGKNKTRIEYYGPSRGYDTMINAVKGWASGKNVGCPDLTK